MANVLVIASKVKKLVKAEGMRTGSDAIEKLSQVVESKIKAGIEKARAEGKKTVQASDLD